MQLIPEKISPYYLIHFLFLMFCYAGTAYAETEPETASLQIEFPGLSSVHTSIRLSDGLAESAIGTTIKNVNWQTNSTTVQVPQGLYDLVIKKGGGELIVDDVDCSASICKVENIVANLTINFPGLSSVHSSVHVPDDNDELASGAKITHKNWQRDFAIIPVLRQIVDLKITKGAATMVVNNVDCRTESCAVNEVTATLTVLFPGMSQVHTTVNLSDDIENSASGEKVTHRNWQTNQAEIIVLRKVYDLNIRRKSDAIIVDDIDCSSGACIADDLTADLTVKFPGLNAIHVGVFTPDDQDNVITGNKVLHKNWQTNEVLLKVFKKSYDVSIARKNSTPIIKDSVDCSPGQCLIDKLVTTLTVNFAGMSGVHTSVHDSDNQANNADGVEFTHKNWQRDQVEIVVLKKRYDVKIRRNNGEPMIVDDLDCSTNNCSIDQLTAQLTVKFPALRGVHTSVFDPEGDPEKPEFKLNWQTNQAVLTVFKKKYNVSVRKDHSDPLFVNNVDCRQGACLVDQITATMTVAFDGMRSVHTSVFADDQQAGINPEKKVTKLNWQNNQAIIPVLRQFYDVSIHQGHSEPVIVEAVNCTSGSCNINEITADLTVEFPELRHVHTSIFVDDGKVGSIGEHKVTKLNWQTSVAALTVFKQVYDIQVTKGPVSKIIDSIDCSSGACKVKDLVANLTVKFPGLKSVHSSALVPDGIDNSATGKRAAKSNWKTHETIIPLLRDSYDVKVSHIVDTIFDDVDCNGATCEVLITGNVQAVLINGDSNQPIVDKYLKAYEKLPDGTLVRFQTGKTDPQGRVNFTLAGVDSGRIYVLKTYNPLGNGKSHYSTFITNTGEHQFIVTVDGENSLDLTPPEVAITSPLDGASVTSSGFRITGTATDNRTIDRVELTITDPIKGSSAILPNYDAASQTWTADVAETIITVGQNIVLTATAFDLAQSQQTTSVTVLVVDDNDGPVITFTSHTDNQEVPVTGFLLSGTVTDLTQVASLQATLADSGLGETISNVAVDFASNTGIWTLVVDNGLMTEGGQVNITFNAADTMGNSTTEAIQLLPVAVDFSNAQMINRITFGSTPSLLQEVEAIGAQAFLEQQLEPNSIDDSNFTALIANLPTTKEELQAWTIIHMAYSERQLLEVMTWFWDNHFNTDINTTRTDANGDSVSDTVGYELAENQAFRTNAFGNFRDLLEISAKSPAMLIYLDSISNVADDSNENFTRELLELLSMGVNGGYTHHEIEAGAEIFTGWHLQNDQFFFDASQHTGGSYTVFGTITIADGGVSQGEEFLDAIANHESTANFICTKLIRVFVSDIAPTTLVERCAQTFMDAVADDDQIKQVLRTILESSEFYQPEYYRGKIKTPVELVVGSIRLLDATSTGTDLIGPIRAMGLRLYENPVPTGWSEIGKDWINSSLLLERIKWLNAFVRTTEASSNSASDPIPFYTAHGFATADGIVGFLLQLTIGDKASDLSRQNALDILGTDFDLLNQNSDTLLRQLNGAVMSYPQYQSQ